MGGEGENQSVDQPKEAVENQREQEAQSIVENEAEDSEQPAAEDSAEGTVENEEEKPIRSYRKIIKGVIIGLGAILILYFGMTVYFMERFYFGSAINCINVSGKNIKDVEAMMESELQEYVLTLKMRGGESEQIKAVDIGLKYNSSEDFKKLKDSQKPYKWVLSCFNPKDSQMKVAVSFDEKLLKEQIDSLSCFDSSKIIEPQNPSFQYVDHRYEIVDEIPGNKVNKDILYSFVSDALQNTEAEIDLEAIDCYVKPLYNSESQKVSRARDILDKYASTKITYTFGSSKEVLDGSVINRWLTVDESFEVSIDESKVNDYINVLADKYDTIGRTRGFVTSLGETIQISGGDFGRAINKVKESQSLIAAIKEGRNITKEPAYSQSVFAKGSSDIADTYVEINLEKQYIWFYKDGSLIAEGDIVTGNVKAGNTTPKGVYSLKYKAKNVVLRGPGYAAPVTFWMPFNRGIGIHDASWRSVFGGDIYKTNGSHGCINCPYNVAKAIYSNIEPGTPVICY